MPARLHLSLQDAFGRIRLPVRNTLRRWIEATLQQSAQVTLRFVGRAEGQRINRQFRGRDYATNVLTFSYPEQSPLAGDIVLCMPVVMAEARAQGLTTRAHLAHLIVHGALHMQGYDHEKAREARVMEALESRILRSLGHADPYA